MTLRSLAFASRKLVLGALAVLALSLPAGTAHAGALGVEAVTDAPLDFSARVWGELPYRIRLSLAVGFMPDFYAGGLDGLARTFKQWDDNTGAVIRSSLRNSFVGRAHVGWRPLEDRGLYIDVGYTMVGFGGDNSVASVLGSAYPDQAPPEGGSTSTWKTSSTLHMLDAEIGWQWKLFWQLTLRIAGGVQWTFASSTSMHPTFPSDAPSAETQYTSSVAAYLDGKYKNTVTPSITLALGWQIF